MKQMLVGFFLIFLWPTVGSAQIVPHQAVYAMSLIKRSVGEDLVDVSGDVSFKVSKSCKDWATTHNADIRYYYGGRDSVRSLNTYSSVESLNNNHLIFAVNRSTNGRLDFSSKGEARVSNQGHLGIRYNDTSTNKNSQLNGAFVFPIHHTEKLIQMARKGHTFYRANLYDGGDQDQYHIVNAVFGKPINARDKIKSWPVSMAFYQSNNADAIPAYEMHFNLKSNGVIEQMDITYPHFTVRQTIADLKMLEVPHCD